MEAAASTKQPSKSLVFCLSHRPPTCCLTSRAVEWRADLSPSKHWLSDGPTTGDPPLEPAWPGAVHSGLTVPLQGTQYLEYSSGITGRPLLPRLAAPLHLVLDYNVR